MRETFRSIPVVVTAFVIAAALGVAGCGGGDSTSTGASGASGAAGGTPLSQDEFVSQANAACTEANDKLKALQAPTQGDIQSLATYVAQVLTIAGDLQAKLDVITAPTELQAKYSQYLSRQRAGFALATQIEQAAKSGDSSTASALGQKLSTLSDQANSEADALGLTECAKSVTPQG